MRDWPTAKSAMSIISCTSPSPSALILPISSDDQAAEVRLVPRSASPTSRTASPRLGAGTSRQARGGLAALRHHLLVVAPRVAARTLRDERRRSPG